MSYVHLRNALFLQPLPELSSVTLSSQEPSPDSAGFNDNGESPLTGIFTSATVPESLVANPMGQGDAWRSPPGVSANERGGGRAADGAARTATARELEPVTLRGDTDEVRSVYQEPSSCGARVLCVPAVSQQVFHLW